VESTIAGAAVLAPLDAILYVGHEATRVIFSRSPIGRSDRTIRYESILRCCQQAKANEVVRDRPQNGCANRN
jgi:hypothetical protein